MTKSKRQSATAKNPPQKFQPLMEAAAEQQRLLGMATQYIRDTRRAIQDALVRGDEIPSGILMLNIDDIDDLEMSRIKVTRIVRQLQSPAKKRGAK